MKACIYTRFSPRKNADECESSVTQLARLRPYCHSQGWEIIGELDDSDRTGATTDGRPALAEALDLACRHKAALVVYSLSRLARSTKDAIAIVERLERSGANLVSLHEHIDTSSPMGRFVYRMFASLAELEREQIAERTSDAMRRRQADGQVMGSRAPFGKRIVLVGGSKRLEDDPDQQAALARMLELSSEGHGSQAICSKLAASGILLHRGTVERILKRHAIGSRESSTRN